LVYIKKHCRFAAGRYVFSAFPKEICRGKIKNLKLKNYLAGVICLQFEKFHKKGAKTLGIV